MGMQTTDEQAVLIAVGLALMIFLALVASGLIWGCQVVGMLLLILSGLGALMILWYAGTK